MVRIALITYLAFQAPLPSLAASARVLERVAGPTLTAIELDQGDVLLFKLKNGQVRRLELSSTWAGPLFSNKDGRAEQSPEMGNKLVYGFSATFKADGHPLTLQRLVGTQESFYEPTVINGMRVWLDAVQDIFNVVKEAHGECKPRRQARLAVQDASLAIAPEPILPWYPDPGKYINIADCYFGDDCWLGAYAGTDAHGGLDIEMPSHTVLRSPFKVDTQGLLLATAKGDKNNRWEGVRTWGDGSVWALQVSHVGLPSAAAGQPLEAGGIIGKTALTAVGYAAHSHFNFFIREKGGDIALDPWILFWQSYQEAGTALDAPGPQRTGRLFQVAGPEGSQDYAWSFGDGSVSRERKPKHRYGKAGVYPITLTLDGRRSQTIHVTVDGPPSKLPILELVSEDFSFRPEPAGVYRAYREARDAPHRVKLLAMSDATVESLEDQRSLAKGEKPYYDFAPGKAVLQASLPDLEAPSVAYQGRGGWLEVQKGPGNKAWTLRAQPRGLEAGSYRAQLAFEAHGALNGSQSVEVELEVTPLSPAWNAVVDDNDPGFEKSPGFWVLPTFPSWWARPGYGGSAQFSGRRPDPDQAARFTPYLWGGTYNVSLGSQTPFDKDSRFQVRIRHASGLQTRWVEPGKSLDLGEHRFNFGNRGWVEVLTAGSRGQVTADALFFTRTAD